jgi:hypothetical protein
MANTLKIKRGAAASIPTGQLAEPLFTSDTYDLYIGTGASNQRFQKYIASGTSSQFLKGDGSLDSTTYEPSITAGTTLQYYRGDKTFQTLDTNVVPENGAIYFTEPRVRSTVLTGLNLTGGGTIAATDSILQAFGKVQNQISALVGSVYYAGTWNASTNSPTLASGTGTKGYYYIVTTAGSTNLDGITDWKIGDWAIFNGTTWDKVDNTDAVSSVNGFTGAVNLALDNISDVSAASPTNAQLLRFNGTSSLWENWTPTFEPALTKGNLSSGDTSYLTVTGGTGAVIGSGTTVSVYAAGVVNGGLTLTTTGNSGAATKSFATLNIPEYTLAGLGGVPTTRTLTINGTAYDLSADRSWSVGTVTGTGTTGTIPKWSSSSALNDSVITQSGSDILIGGTADQGKLQVDGQTAGGLLVTTTNSQFGIGIKNTSSSNKKWDISPNGNNLQINESGVTTRMAFIAGGNVAINDIAAGLRLTIVGTEGNPATTGTSQNGSLRFGGGDFVLDMGNSIGDGTAAQYTAWLQATSKAALGTNYKISLNPNGGNVGIGMLNPEQRLHVENTFNGSTWVKVSNGSNAAGAAAGILMANDGGDLGAISILSSGNSPANALFIRTLSTNSLILGANGGTNLTIANGGAATFSSSVTAVQGNFNQTATSGFALSMKNRNATQQWGMVVDTNAVDDKIFGLYDVTNSFYALKIAASTGAATFSSSVTAGQMNVSAPATTTYGSLNATTNAYAYQEYKYNNTTYGYIGQHSAFIGGASSTDLAIISVNNLIFGTSGSFTERMRITSGGYVGIGTSSPAGQFEVYTDGYRRLFTSNIDAYTIRLVLGANSYFQQDANNEELRIAQQYGTGKITFYTGNPNTERMRITSAGNVGIACTPNYGRLEIQGATTDKRLYVGTAAFYSNSIDILGISSIGGEIPVGIAGSELQFWTNATKRMTITNGGNIEATGSIKTGNPTSGTAKPWKLGSRIVGTCTTSTTAYLEVDVDGTLYYLAFANPS